MRMVKNFGAKAFVITARDTRDTIVARFICSRGWGRPVDPPARTQGGIYDTL